MNDEQVVQDIDRILSDKTLPISEERKMNLGLEAENVLFKYKFDQLDHPDTYLAIKQTIKDDQVKKGIIHGDLIPEAINRLVKALSNEKIPFTIVKDPEYKGEIAFILSNEN